MNTFASYLDQVIEVAARKIGGNKTGRKIIVPDHRQLFRQGRHLHVPRQRDLLVLSLLRQHGIHRLCPLQRDRALRCQRDRDTFVRRVEGPPALVQQLQDTDPGFVSADQRYAEQRAGLETGALYPRRN